MRATKKEGKKGDKKGSFKERFKKEHFTTIKTNGDFDRKLKMEFVNYLMKGNFEVEMNTKALGADLEIDVMKKIAELCKFEFDFQSHYKEMIYFVDLFNFKQYSAMDGPTKAKTISEKNKQFGKNQSMKLLKGKEKKKGLIKIYNSKQFTKIKETLKTEH